MESDDQVLSALNAAIRSDPENAMSFANRGALFLRASAYDKARADFDKAISLDPKDPLAYSNRSSLFMLQTETEKALSDIDEAIRLSPDHSYGYFHRACIWAMRKEYQKALDDFDKAIGLGPDSPANGKTYLAIARLRASCPDCEAPGQEGRDRAGFQGVRRHRLEGRRMPDGRGFNTGRAG